MNDLPSSSPLTAENSVPRRTISLSRQFRLNAPQVDALIASSTDDDVSGLDLAEHHHEDDSSLSSNEEYFPVEGGPTSKPPPPEEHRPSLVTKRTTATSASTIPPPNSNERVGAVNASTAEKNYKRYSSDRRFSSALSSECLPQEEEDEARRRVLFIIGLIVVVVLIGGIAAIVALCLRRGGDDDDHKKSENNSDTDSDDLKLVPEEETPFEDVEGDPFDIEAVSPTLKTILETGVLKCGITDGNPGLSTFNKGTQSYEGFDVDLCRAVAVAIFGEDGHVKYEETTAFERFSALAEGTVDLLARGTTLTMERSLREPNTGIGFRFSIPYLYNGLQFGGTPPYVFCADNFDNEGDCADTVVCVLDSSTHYAEILSLNPNASIISVVDSLTMFRNFIDGFCNVIAGEQHSIAESVGREQGYLGEYEYGSKVISKEPLALVTRADDPAWSDFVNWVVEALLTAEDQRITQRTAHDMGLTNAFGSRFRTMFRDVVGLVGNYGEVFTRNLEPILPRPIADEINAGTTGLIYAFPFGSLDATAQFGPSSTQGGVMQKVVSRGKLVCGVISRPLFAEFDSASNSWSGFDVDFCRAVAAAIFTGRGSEVVFQDVSIENAFLKLDSGDLDILAGVPSSMRADVRELASNSGFSFSQPTYYDGLTFGGISMYTECAEELDTNSLDCRDLRLCVEAGSFFETRLRDLLPERVIVPVQSPVDGLINSDCNAIAGTSEAVALSAVRRSGYDSLAYTVGKNRLSIRPMALATRQDDHQWNQFVYWIVSTIFYAEEKGVIQMTADDLPLVRFFGPTYDSMLREAVGAIGSYKEIYERNLEMDIPRGGLNLVNKLLRGPQHYPLPGIPA